MMTEYRGAVGKLAWLADTTRPDVAYDCLELSTHNREANIKDIKHLNKVIEKMKKRSGVVKYSHVGDLKTLKILTISDGSYLKLENKTISICGEFIFLSNADETKISPIFWKSKSISTVCKSAKTVEMQATDKCMENTIYISRCINKVYTGS